jgi:hypothetical protein
MDRISRALAAVIRVRVAVLVLYAVLVPLAIWRATLIPNHGGIDRLIVPSDPDVQVTRAFQAVFPEQQTALLVFEADDPWSPAAVARVDRAKTLLGGIPHVGTFSVLDALRRSRPAATLAELRALAEGTSFFAHQGLVGPHFMTLLANLDVRDGAERDAALASIDAVISREGLGPVREVGEPFATSWIEREANAASGRAFPIFGVLLVAITLFLFRSPRTLLAICLALGSAVALAVAAGDLLGFAFTLVSVLVPLTILVTTLATLVYLHSRYLDGPDQLTALRNKFLPVTASTLAAAMGFAALAVSHIQPIREMGIWTAVGLAIAWVVSYTLFPALQLVLRTPTTGPARRADDLYERLSRRLPAITYRFRWPFVIGALAACALGASLLRGTTVEADALSNIDPDAQVAIDLRWFRDHVTDLNVARIWIHLPQATATDPEVLRAVDNFQTAVEHAPDVTGVTGPTTLLRMRSYLAGHGEALPQDPAAFAHATDDVEQLMLTEPDLRTFIDVNGLADLQMTVLFRHGDAAGYAAMAERVHAAWDATRAKSPALAGADARLTGETMLQVKVGASLVPSLAQSFTLTVAMIPSLVALLVTFIGMRAFGGSLNVATIVIATTILGTTENDQIHFFHHMHERDGEPLEVRLRHALHVSGRAIVFATLINSAGFIGLAVSKFPPLRQFGLMTSAAFLLALIADFTALPAALWIASREKPKSTD